MRLLTLITYLKRFSKAKKLTSTDHMYKTKLKKETLSNYLIANTARDYLLQLKLELEKEFITKQASSSSIKHQNDEHPRESGIHKP
jgi:hypothetical protein